MEKIRTSCCALCQIARVSNDTTITELRLKMAQLKHEKNINNEVGVSRGNGQTAVFIIVSPGEEKLRSNLVELGFDNKHTFERRVGYPDGDLQMYIKNL